LRVPAKHLIVEVRAPGFETARHEVEAEAGAVERETFSLQPVSAPAAALPAQVVVPVLAAAEEPAPRGHAQRTLGWIAAGSAAVFLAGGITSTIYAADSASRYNSTPACYSGPPSDACSSYVSRLNTSETLEVVAYSAAGLAAVGSALLFLTSPRDNDHRAARAGAWCLPSPGGLACGIAY
jgi:hypothetical protein